jgi:hypothetical protein
MHFFYDSGLGKGSYNLQCRVNNHSVEVVYESKERIRCLLEPHEDVKAYTISISTNFGDQWIFANDWILKLVDLPHVAGLYPTRLPSNVISQVEVNLTYTGLDE